MGLPLLAQDMRIVLEKLKETRTIRIRGKNVDDLDLEQLGNLIQQANDKSSKINLKGMFKRLKRSPTNTLEENKRTRELKYQKGLSCNQRLRSEKMAKARILTVSSIILIALIVLPLLVVRAENYTVGVKAGDWIKYGQFTVTWNGTGTEPSSVTEQKKTDWARIDVEDVTGTTVTVNLTTHYNNGTQTSQTIDVDVTESRYGYFIIASDLKSGDNITSQASSPTINRTTTGRYAEVTRNVNVLEVTTVFQNRTMTSKIYWDQSTGIMVEAYLVTPDYGNPAAYISFSIKATETNMWNANLIDIITGNPIYIIAAAIIIIVALITVAIFLRMKKLQSPPPPPPPSPQVEPGTGQWS